MRVIRFDTWEECPHSRWHELTDVPYQRPAWFRACEGYFKDVAFRYYLCFEGHRLLAILPTYNALPPCYAGPPRILFHECEAIGRALRWSMAGAPLSFQAGIIGAGDCAEALARAWKTDLNSEGFDAASFPYSRQNLVMQGFQRGPSLVDYELELPGHSFEDYLCLYERKRRRSIEREIESTREVMFEDMPLLGQGDCVAAFRNATASRYGSLNTLSADFYERLGEYFGGSARAILAKKEGRTVGALSYLLSEHTLYLFHAGCDKLDFLHFNLMFYESIRAAYRLGRPRINFRPSDGRTKRYRKANAIQTSIYFAPTSRRAKFFFSAFRYLRGGRRAFKTLLTTHREKGA